MKIMHVFTCKWTRACSDRGEHREAWCLVQIMVPRSRVKTFGEGTWQQPPVTHSVGAHSSVPSSCPSTPVTIAAACIQQQKMNTLEALIATDVGHVRYGCQSGQQVGGAGQL
jgi:hypothetical protein